MPISYILMKEDIMTFTKMHSLGNDYVYIDLFNNKLSFKEQISRLSQVLSNRNYGVGSDGIILISKSDKADFKFQIYNSDGSEASMCGNGIRCAGAYVYRKGLTKKTNISFETKSGIRKVRLIFQNNKIDSVTADLGEPAINLRRVNVDNQFIFTPVYVGNTHGVTVVKSVDNIDVNALGEVIEKKIPNSNLEFIELMDSNNIKMRVYERGSKETLACGTGAAASVVYTYLSGLTGRKVNVKLLGGELEVNYSSEDNHVYISSPVEEVFNGEMDDRKVLKLVK